MADVSADFQIGAKSFSYREELSAGTAVLSKDGGLSVNRPSLSLSVLQRLVIAGQVDMVDTMPVELEASVIR